MREWCHSCIPYSPSPHRSWRSLSCISGSLSKFRHSCNPRVPARNPDIVCCWSTRFCMKREVHLAEEVWIFGFRGRFQLWFWIQAEIFFSFLQLAGGGGLLVVTGRVGLHLEEEFLRVGADLRSAPGLEELLDFLPVLAVEAQACMEGGVPSRKRRCSSWVHRPLDLAGVSVDSYIWIFRI